MKRFSVLAVTLLLGAAGYVWSQGGDVDAHYLKQAFNRATATAAEANKTTGYGYSDGISILGAWANRGDTLTFTLPLTSGVNYMFLAAGDQDCQDIALELTDNANRVVASENRVAPDAMVSFNPPANASYTMRLTLAKSRKDLPCVCTALILKENGLKVPLENLDDCALDMLNLFTGTDKLLKQKDRRALQLRKSKNQWAVFGAVLSPGEERSVTNLDLSLAGRGVIDRKLFFALGDKKAEDVDIVILDNNGNKVAEDVKTDREAIVGFTPTAGQRYGFKMINFKGNGPSVIMTGVFDIMLQP